MTLAGDTLVKRFHGKLDILDGLEDGVAFWVQEGVFDCLLQRALLELVYVVQVFADHCKKLGVGVQIFFVALHIGVLFNRTLNRKMALWFRCLQGLLVFLKDILANRLD